MVLPGVPGVGVGVGDDTASSILRVSGDDRELMLPLLSVAFAVKL